MEIEDDAQTSTWARIRCTAFAGTRRLASGELRDVAVAVKRLVLTDPHASALLFDDDTGRRIEVDLRGSEEELVRRLEALRVPSGGAGEAPPPRQTGPGRPRLGVVAREVTLLPRHWEWLNRQPGGASVALRRLVEEARRAHADRDRTREEREAAYRFMSGIAGDLPGFEEATRALFAGNREAFDRETSGWPPDVRDYAARFAEAAFSSPESDTESEGK